MNLSITPVPLWLSILFVVCFATFPVFLIANTIKESYVAINDYKSYRLKRNIVGFYWGYLCIVGVASVYGFFAVNVLPPRILVATALPLFLFYMFVVRKLKWFREVFKIIRLEQLIYIHTFRFVGVFFLLVYAYDALPARFAYVGAIGDVVTASLVFPVIKALKANSKYGKTWALLWNVFGLLDILLVMLTAVLITKTTIAEGTEDVLSLGAFPFSWIPALAPATIVFLHILIFQKLLNKK